MGSKCVWASSISFSDADKGKKTNVLVLFCFAATKPQLCAHIMLGGGIGNSIAQDIFVRKTSVKARIASFVCIDSSLKTQNYQVISNDGFGSLISTSQASSHHMSCP
jgi:hypothetical protein